MRLCVHLLVLCAFSNKIWESTAFTPPSLLHIRQPPPPPPPPSRKRSRHYATIPNTNQQTTPPATPLPFKTKQKIVAPAPPILETITETPTKIATDITQKQKTKLNQQTQTSTQTKNKNMAAVKVHGTSLRTCSFDKSVNRAHVFMKTDGRPLHARVELWSGPENAPQIINVDVEDGSTRPFSCIVETPGEGNAIAIRNTGGMATPLYACVNADTEEEGPIEDFARRTKGRIVQGGAVYSVPCPANVGSVQLMLHTDGRPLSARIELLQGPNNVKQRMEVYTEEGLERPFFVVVDTPGAGNLVRIENTATIEYPLSARVEPFMVREAKEWDGDPGIRWS